MDNVPSLITPRYEPARRWDGGDHTVKLVRRADDTAYLVAIPCASPWVLRRRWLTPADLD